jgi:tetratricopeptide (TPR) repeat protein
MRQPLNPSVLRGLFVMLALMFVGAHARPAFADDRTEARTHYQAGVKFYAGGDYRSAIREFNAAQALVPADLNNYNLGLCYDKLGDAEPAMQFYRAYLDKVPNTDKRAEIEASIQRLDAAAKSVAAKKADEARKADDARKLVEEQKRLEDQKKADDARRAEDARLAQLRAQQSDPGMSGAGPSGVGPSVGPAAPATTGDAQLDRVQGIDVSSIRDQRVGGAVSGIPANDPHGPSAGMGATANVSAGGGVAQAAPPVQGAPQAGAPNAPNPNGTPMNGEPPKAEAPIYKKWWFWAVVAVSAYVVYQIATDDSSSSNSARLLPEVGGAKSAAQPGGLTLMSW